MEFFSRKSCVTHSFKDAPDLFALRAGEQSDLGRDFDWKRSDRGERAISPGERP